MTGLVRKAMLLAACGLLCAGVAMAHVPDPANSECNNVGTIPLGFTCSKTIYVVGQDAGGIADPVGEFCVTVRDFNNVPIENASVVIDFTDCDVQLCYEQDVPNVADINDGVQVECTAGGPKTVRKLTDANGEACFSIKGQTKAFIDCTALKECVRIYADGVFLCALDAAIFDLIKDAVIDPNDLATWLYLSFNCPEGPYRGNYDCTNQGVLDPGDLAVWLYVSFGNYVVNCAGDKTPIGPKCPD